MGTRGHSLAQSRGQVRSSGIARRGHGQVSLQSLRRSPEGNGGPDLERMLEPRSHQRVILCAASGLLDPGASVRLSPRWKSLLSACFSPSPLRLCAVPAERSGPLPDFSALAPLRGLLSLSLSPPPSDVKNILIATVSPACYSCWSLPVLTCPCVPLTAPAAGCLWNHLCLGMPLCVCAGPAFNFRLMSIAFSPLLLASANAF